MTHFPTRTRTSTQAHGSPFDTRARAFLFYNIYPTCTTLLLLLLRKSIQRNSVKQRSARGKRVGVRARARARARVCVDYFRLYRGARNLRSGSRVDRFRTSFRRPPKPPIGQCFHAWIQRSSSSVLLEGSSDQQGGGGGGGG